MAKIRAGFVSNSSSSSFIVGVNPGAKLTVDKLMELFKIPADSPLYEMNKEIAGCLLRRMEQTYGYDSLEDAKAERYYERSDMAVMEKHAGMEMYRGHVSNEDGGVEAMLCDATINIDTPDIFIKKEGGY
jgi:hypothetical protein